MNASIPSSCIAFALAIGSAVAMADELTDPIEILDEEDKKIGELPAQRVYMPDFGEYRSDARLGVTQAGHVYVGMGEKLCWSEDGGRTWQSRDLPTASGGFGVLKDDTLVVFSDSDSGCRVHRSTDYGRSWSEFIPLDITPYDTGGRGWTHVSSLPDGTALMTVTLRWGDGAKGHDGKPLAPEKLGIYDHIFRSSDGGKTWPVKTLIVPDSAETSLLRLKSGKMLAAIRKQRHPQRFLPGDDIEKLRAMDGWRDDKPYIKHAFFADSYDDGRTWANERLAPGNPTMKHGLCPSELVQLADGHVVWIYTRRFGKDPNAWLGGEGQGIYARRSADEGKTWGAERYCVRFLRQKGYTPYPASAVLGDGTILTVTGRNRGGNRAMAVRWRLPTK